MLFKSPGKVLENSLNKSYETCMNHAVGFCRLLYLASKPVNWPVVMKGLSSGSVGCLWP